MSPSYCWIDELIFAKEFIIFIEKKVNIFHAICYERSVLLFQRCSLVFIRRRAEPVIAVICSCYKQDRRQKAGTFECSLQSHLSVAESLQDSCLVSNQ